MLHIKPMLHNLLRSIVVHCVVVMLAIISLLFVIVTIAHGESLQEEEQDLSATVVTYDDIWYSTLGPSPQQRAEAAGYTAETHEVVTEDGYILQVHRITGSKLSPKAENKPAVLLIHGLLDCSATWVLACPEKSLGYILADNGYDVWMGNVRGNRYARQHKTLTTKSKAYWLFSWHEMGMFDLPATIDHILEVTKQKKLIYVGHSQGSTAFFVMASMRPEYQDKVEALFGLAPAVFMSRATQPVIRLLAPFVNDIKALADLIGLYEFMPTGKFIQRIEKVICQDHMITQPLCKTAMVIIGGFGEKLLNNSLISEIVQYDPAGASTRSFIHYAQSINSGRFRLYDHGLIKNLKKYGTAIPPDYPIENIKIPVYLSYGNNDEHANSNDVYTLCKTLPNCNKFMVPDPSFTHIDFIWSGPIDTLLYNRVLSLMSRHVHH